MKTQKANFKKLLLSKETVSNMEGLKGGVEATLGFTECRNPMFRNTDIGGTCSGGF